MSVAEFLETCRTSSSDLLVIKLLLSFNSPCPPSDRRATILMAGATFLSVS
jgi:hypothetical protein